MPNTERLELVLKAIVEHYIETARPVSSKLLQEEYGFASVSSATLRNDMVYLENEGYITQPHTSSGRIPTEKGYQDYIANFMAPTTLSKKQRLQVEAVNAVGDIQKKDDRVVREMAKKLSELTDEVVLVSLNGQDYYAAGISNVFRKPEFAEHAEKMLEIGKMIDNLDDAMSKLKLAVARDIEVLIGEANPIAQQTSIVASQLELPAGDAVIGILGPMRMDYGTNIAILEYMTELLNEEYDG